MPRSDGNGNWLIKPHTGISVILVIAILGGMASAVTYGVGLKTTVDYHIGDTAIHPTSTVLAEQYVTREHHADTMLLIEAHLAQMRADVERLTKGR